MRLYNKTFSSNPSEDVYSNITSSHNILQILFNVFGKTPSLSHTHGYTNFQYISILVILNIVTNFCIKQIFSENSKEIILLKNMIAKVLKVENCLKNSSNTFSSSSSVILGHPRTVKLWRGHDWRWRFCLCTGEEGLCEGRTLDPRSCCGTPRSRLVHSYILSSHKRPLCWPKSRSMPSNRYIHAVVSKYLLLPAGHCARYISTGLPVG